MIIREMKIKANGKRLTFVTFWMSHVKRDSWIPSDSMGVKYDIYYGESRRFELKFWNISNFSQGHFRNRAISEERVTPFTRLITCATNMVMFGAPECVPIKEKHRVSKKTNHKESLVFRGPTVSMDLYKRGRIFRWSLYLEKYAQWWQLHQWRSQWPPIWHRDGF